METFAFWACDYCYTFVKKDSFGISAETSSKINLPKDWEKINGRKEKLFCPECVKAAKLNAIIGHEMYG